MNGSPPLQSMLAKKKTSLKSALPSSVSTTTEALILCPGIAHVSECIADGRLLAKNAVEDGLFHRGCGAGSD